jgi:putative glutamine amidotransferase
MKVEKSRTGKSGPVIVTNLDLDEKSNNLMVPFNYLRALKQAGAVPVCLPPVLDKRDLSLALKNCDGVLLTGGRDYDPHLWGGEIHEENVLISQIRQEFDILLGRLAWDNGYPVLGICGGHQLINILAGGTLYTSVQTQVPQALVHRPRTFTSPPVYHQVTIDMSGRLFDGLESSELKTNSYHHQAVKDLGAGLRVTGKTSDGVIEAVEGTGAPVFGVQWHPEKELDDPVQQKIFRNFVAICRQNKKG